jgi:hypothetical protein
MVDRSSHLPGEKRISWHEGIIGEAVESNRDSSSSMAVSPSLSKCLASDTPRVYVDAAR